MLIFLQGEKQRLLAYAYTVITALEFCLKKPRYIRYEEQHIRFKSMNHLYYLVINDMKGACFLLSARMNETIWLNHLKCRLLSVPVGSLGSSCWVPRENHDTNKVSIGHYQAIIDCVGYPLLRGLLNQLCLEGDKSSRKILRLCLEYV